MIRKKKVLILCLAISAMLLCGCSAGSITPAPVNGLDALSAMQVISRKEGSGTRSAFAELVGFGTSTDGTKEDDTTNDAIIADSTAFRGTGRGLYGDQLSRSDRGNRL